ncbi:hypothetical protein B5C34_12825 [Pacificimonas flava]|uniref:Uncharacterized protein n=2 Tax=Pacificimonas TaxID=1960290 RepID=A0A219B7U5_9SPHN|nr:MULTISPECIES: BlaI/MecI/CopY family transcriptional regulator [Pacificimonas]MBZ6378449.1 BlaI/MecI/CopY family transcriptional regulator [Pacificimonas aurantium]OWV34254.1 hypothetical protein B5C34_12825 [Pacificimonas flava]
MANRQTDRAERHDLKELPRRERELFELLYAAGVATASDLHEKMTDPPSYSAVRALLSRLEGRGFIRRKTQAGRGAIRYECVPQSGDVRASALSNMVRTFFDGSASAAATALLGMSEELSSDDLDTIQKMIDRQKKREGGNA